MSINITDTTLYKNVYSKAKEAYEKPEKRSGFLKASAYTAGGVALGAGFLMLFLSKSASNKLSKIIEKNIIDIKEKMNTMALEGESAVKRNTYKFYSKVMDAYSFVQGAINTMALKDAFLKKYLPNWYNKMCENFYKRQSAKTVSHTYAKVYANMDEFFTQALGHLEGKNGYEEARVLISEIKTAFDKGFGHQARTGRARTIEEDFVDLDKRLIEFLNRARKERGELINFAKKDIVSGTKEKITNEIAGHKGEISTNIESITQKFNAVLVEIKTALSLKDSNEFVVLKEITKKIKEYSKLNGSNEQEARQKLVDDLTESLNKLKQSVLSGQNPHKENVLKLIESLVEIIKNSKKGKMEELLSILRQNCDDVVYKKQIYPHSQAVIKKLNSATEVESEKYVEKMRDVALGSAATDILTPILGAGIFGGFLVNTDSKEEAASLAIKSGLPLMAAVFSMYYATARLISGLMSIGFGALCGTVVGAVSSSAGEKMDVYFKNQKKIKEFYTAYHGKVDNTPTKA